MLIDALLRLVHGGVRVRAVILTRRVLTTAEVVGGGRRVRVRVRGVLVDSGVCSMRVRMRVRVRVRHHMRMQLRQRIVTVVAVPVTELMGTGHVHSVIRRRRHFHLPQRVLRVDAPAVIRIRVAVLHVSHVHPWKDSDDRILFDWVLRRILKKTHA